jgi:hypothetical protein
MCLDSNLYNREAANDMQEELPEGTGGENTEAQQLDVEKWGFALSLLKEAVTIAGIKDFSEYKGEPLNLRWRIYPFLKQRQT